MDLNNLIFPSPKSSYKATDFKGQLIWIPRKIDFSEREKIKYSFSKVSCLLKRNSIYAINDHSVNLKGRTLCASKGKGTLLRQCNTMKSFKIYIKNKEKRLFHTKSQNFINNNSTKENFKEFNLHESSGQDDFDYSCDSDVEEETKVNFRQNFKSSKVTNQEVTELSNKKNVEYIPCLFIKFPYSQSKKLILYFHANYEDLGQTKQIIQKISDNLKINILSVEFPNYGLYKTPDKTNAEHIIQDSEILIKFLTNVMKISLENIIIMGRCIGSGPAMHLAANYNVNALILISPIKSIKEAVKSIFDKYATGWLFKYLVKER